MRSWFWNFTVESYDGRTADIIFPESPTTFPDNFDFTNEFRSLFGMVSGDFFGVSGWPRWRAIWDVSAPPTSQAAIQSTLDAYAEPPPTPQEATITLNGIATAGDPLPEMYLAIFVDDVLENVATIPNTPLNVNQTLTLVYNVAGSHIARGTVILTNSFGSQQYDTAETPFTI